MKETEGVFSGRQRESQIQESQPQVWQEAQMPQEYQYASPVRKFFAGIVVSILILAAFIGIQIVVSVMAIVGKAVPFIETSNGDMNDIMTQLQPIIQDPVFMTNLTVIATVVSAVAAVFFYWLIFGRKKTMEDKRFFREKVLKGRVFVMIWIAAFGLYYLAILISGVIEAASPQTMQDYTEMMDLALGGNLLAAMLAAVLLAPISEECILRGLILKNLQKYFSAPVVIIIQAVLFGVFHMNWVQGLYVVPVGAALGFVALKCRSVLPSIFMHMVYNFMSVFVALLPAFCQTWIFAVIAVVASGAVVWFMGKQSEGFE